MGLRTLLESGEAHTVGEPGKVPTAGVAQTHQAAMGRQAQAVAAAGHLNSQQFPFRLFAHSKTTTPSVKSWSALSWSAK